MLRQLRFERAAKLSARGLEIATRRGERYALTCLRGELLHDLGDAAASIEAYREGLSQAEDDAERCRARIGLAAGMRVVDRFEDAFAALAEAEAEAGSLIRELAQLHQLRGNLYFPQGDFTRCREQHELALDRARAAGAVDLETRALGGLGDAEYARGRMITANGFFRDCVDLARRHGFRRVEVANLSMVGYSRFYCNEIREIYEDGRTVTEGARAVGDRRAELLGLMLVHKSLQEQGEMKRAKQELQVALDLAERLGAGRFVAEILTHVAMILRLQGQREEARRTIGRALELSLETGPGFNAPRALGEAALNADDPRARQVFLDRGVAILDAGAVAHNHFSFYRDAMESCLQTNDWQGVERYARALWEFTRQEPLPMCDFFMARARALAVLGRGERSEANRADLRRLYEQARDAGLALALPALQAALADG